MWDTDLQDFHRFFFVFFDLPVPFAKQRVAYPKGIPLGARVCNLCKSVFYWVGRGGYALQQNSTSYRQQDLFPFTSGNFNNRAGIIILPLAFTHRDGFNTAI